MEEEEVNFVHKKTKDGKEKPKFVVRTLADLQRLKLEKLMKNPDKLVNIPELSGEKDFKDAIPSFVRNVMGSSAGAGSGEFHVYRHLRRKEYARQKHIQQKSLTEKLDQEYRDRIETNQKVADEKTAKKRAKRLKKKRNAKQKKPKVSSDDNGSDASDSDKNDDDDDDDADQKSEEETSDGNKPDEINDEKPDKCLNSTSSKSPENKTQEETVVAPDTAD